MKQLKLLMLFALLASFSAINAQQKTISGTVKSKTDQLPIPGVNVFIKGTTTGTQTDLDGKYSINIEQGKTLVFSYLGMKDQEVVIANQSTINIILEDNLDYLDEVVVTGYDTKLKVKSTSAISTVKGEEVQDVPFASFEQILQGRLPGVDISSGSGQPGDVASVTIRGINSINGNTTPLYIVDGIQIDPQSFASLNPNDFETYNVLKDAQAKSIYGSRAAAGVIVITTKRGQAGKAKLQYRTYSGWSIAPELNQDVLNPRQYLEFAREFGAAGFGGITDEEIDQRVLDLGGYNLRDDLLRVGQNTNHELVATGGTEDTRYYSSIGYFEQEGTAAFNDLTRLTARVNLDAKLTDRLKVALNTSLGFTRRNLVNSSGGANLDNIYLLPYLGNPVTRVFDEEGNYNTGQGGLFAAGNLLEDSALGVNQNEEFKLITSANFEFKILDQLKANYNIGVDFEDDFRQRGRNPNAFRGNLAAVGNAGDLFENSIRDVNFTNTLTLNYLDTFADKHTVSFTGLVEAIRRDFRSSNFEGFGIDPDLIGFPASITPGTPDNRLIPTVGGVQIVSGLFSLGVFGSYDFDNKYGFEFGLRQDSSSRVAADNTDAVFYSVGLRWNIEEEDFMKDVDWVDVLKLRGGFGTSGNDSSVGENAAFQLLGNPLFQGEPTYVRAGLANPAIGWEITEDLNFGLDYSLFKGKLSGSVDWYKSVTKDLILPFNLSAAFGAGSLNENAGTLENTGVEAAINYTVLQSDDWRVKLHANGAYNFGVITDLGQQDQFTFGTSIARVGEQIQSIFEVPFVGVNPQNGDALYLDLDGNVTNQYSDGFARTGFGSSIPLYTGGFGLDVNYKNLSLSSLFVYQAEVNRINNDSFFLENINLLNQGFNQSVTVLDRWQEPGDITNMPRYTQNRFFSSADIEDASFLRLRDVTLAYNFDEKLLKNLPISSMRLYARGVNLLTFTKWTGLDPESDSNIQQFEYANPTIYTIGLDVNF
jgi:TonB-linked SusC/RagA family outer membrane protein